MAGWTRRQVFGISSSLVLGAALSAAAAACGSGSTSSSSGSGTSSTGSPGGGLRSSARDAYIFAYPLVMNYRTMYKQAIEGDHAFGKWLHLGTSSSADTDIVTPNNDTPYSYAWVDLRAEPWVLTMPGIEANRYYTSQWDDLWGFVLDNPGSVLDGNNGISVLLTAPDWKGQIPPGIARVIKGESDILGTLTRTQLLATEGGIDRVRQIQQQYQLRPLSTFQNTASPAAAPAVQWPVWTEGDEQSAKFWDYVAFLLTFITPNPADQPMYDKLASLGITRDQPWNQASLDSSVRDALAGGVTDGQAQLKKLSQGDVHSEDLFKNRAGLGTDYTSRALGVYMGIFGNVAQQAVYYTLPSDSTGAALDGGKGSYMITFPPGKQPPVKYFWSFTMYKVPERLLVANPIDRYSIGSSTPGTTKNPDGSTTVYFSAKSPGQDKESNWLPAPDGPFWVVLRTYGPEQAILDKTWQPPKVDRHS